MRKVLVAFTTSALCLERLAAKMVVHGHDLVSTSAVGTYITTSLHEANHI